MSSSSSSSNPNPSTDAAASAVPPGGVNGECSMCGDEGTVVFVPPKCKHALCHECWQTHLSVQLEKNPPAYLAGECTCPHAPKCKQLLPPSFVSSLQSPAIASRVSHLLTTVPSKFPSSKLTLADFNYQYDEHGVLKHIQTQSGFAFVSQRHYEALGDAVIPELYGLLRTRGGLEEIWLPVDPIEDSTSSSADTAPSAKKPKHEEKQASSTLSSSPHHLAPRVNIFTSPDIYTNTNTLCVLIHGSGAVRAGMWARALCINNSLDVGSVLPYIAQARERGWSVAVTNTNANYAFIPDPVQEQEGEGEEDAKRLHKQITPQQYYLSTDRKTLNFEKGREVKVPGLEDPRKHTLYVWDHVLSRSPAANIVIVAHSAGGVCAMTLLRQRGASVLSRLRAVAFTDSVHEVLPSDPRPVAAFIRSHAVNWVTSDKPLDTPIKPKCEMFGYGMGTTHDGCELRSSGHTKHEWTSGSSITAVFRYFDQKVAATSSSSSTTSSSAR